MEKRSFPENLLFHTAAHYLGPPNPIPHEKDAKDFYPLSNWFLDLFSKEYDGLRRNQSPHCGFEYPIPATV